MSTILIILLAAAVATGLSQWLRMPPLPVLVLAGGVLAWSGALPTAEVGADLLALGLTFLVFAAGLELDPRRIGSHLKAAIRVGLVQFIGVAALGLGAAMLLGLGVVVGTYVALGLAASSTIVGVRLLVQRGQLFEPFGRMVLGVLILQDVLMITAFAVLSGVDDGLTGIARGLLSTLGLGALALVFIRWIGPWLLLRLQLDQETLVLTALAVLFAFCGLANFLGLPIVVGAFLAGVSLSVFPVGGVIRAPIGSLAHFFSAIFFVALGASLTFPELRWLLIAAALVAMVIVITPTLVVLASLRTNISTRAAIEAGLVLGQCGELAIVLALLGETAGHIDREAFSAIALMSVISMMLTPIIATEANAWRLLRRLPRMRTVPPSPLSDHIVLIGCGMNSRVLLDLLMLSGREVVVIDQDPNIVDAQRRRGVPAVRGDGADPRVLDAAHVASARAVISTMRRRADNERLCRHVGASSEAGRESVPRVFVRTFDDLDVAALERAGASAISEAQAAADDFLAEQGI